MHIRTKQNILLVKSSLGQAKKNVLSRYLPLKSLVENTTMPNTNTPSTECNPLQKDLRHIDDILSSPVRDQDDRGSHENMHPTMKELAQLVKAISLPAMHFNTKNNKNEILGKKRTPY